MQCLRNKEQKFVYDKGDKIVLIDLLTNKILGMDTIPGYVEFVISDKGSNIAILGYKKKFLIFSNHKLYAMYFQQSFDLGK